MELQQRKQRLRALYNQIKDSADEIAAAIKSDFNKNEFDCYATEIGLVLGEIGKTLKKLSSWTKPRRVNVSLSNFPGSGKIYPEPYGRALIIAPWNYPFQLALVPLVGAIAAGNRVVLKPSAKTPATYKIIEKILSKVFFGDEVTVTHSRDVLEDKYDIIFFTGGANTGKDVVRAAAEHLTPVILELGGKSPAIVDSSANIPLAAKRLAWAKFLNAGQTCVAPDYICVHKSVINEFTECFIAEIKKQYYVKNAESDTQLILSDDFTHLISESKASEMQSLIEGEEVLFGGDFRGRIMSPTVIKASFNSDCMRDEIFAPLAPIIEFEEFEELEEKIREREKPLALYYFGKNKNAALKIPFGGGAINDAVMHVAEHNLPFGGVGKSGMGNYHGKASFKAFSHFKSVLIKGKIDVPLRYAPHSKKAVKLIKKIIK